jgi:predicted GTPase
MGYYREQVKDLEQTIAATECDTVVVATPIDLRHLVDIQKLTTRVRYALRDIPGGSLEEEIVRFLSRYRR